MSMPQQHGYRTCIRSSSDSRINRRRESLAGRKNLLCVLAPDRTATVGESSKALRVKLFNGLKSYQVTPTCWTPTAWRNHTRAGEDFHRRWRSDDSSQLFR